MTLLTDKNKFYGTTDATATAADIASGKTAYVNGGKVTGTVDLSGDGTILHWNIGNGPAGVYALDLTDAEYADPGVLMTSSAGTWQRDGNGYIYNPSGSASFYIDLPAKTTEIRRYILTMYGNGGVNPNRWHLHTNHLDATHHWYSRLMSLGTAWATEMYEYNGTEIQRDVETFSTAIGMPTYFNIVIDDHGDLLTYATQATQQTPVGVTDHHVAILEYYVASRSNKSTQAFGINAINGSNFLYLNSLKIIDVPTI